MVGRDILIGVAVGLGYDLVFQLSTMYGMSHGARPQQSINLDTLLGFRITASAIAERMTSSVAFSLVFFLIFFVFRLIARKEWLAGIFFVLMFSLSRGLTSQYPEAATPAFMLVYAVIVAMLLRFGLLSLVVALFITDLLPNILFTTNFSAWYGTASLTGVILVVGGSLFAFRQALGGRRLLAPLLDE